MAPRHAALFALITLLAVDLGGIAFALDRAYKAAGPALSAESLPRPSPPTGTALQSTNGRSHWLSRSSSIVIHALAVSPLHPSQIYAATAGGFLRSDDAGGHWTSYNKGLPPGDPQIWSLTPFDGGSRLAAAADNAHVYTSDDNGAHWHTAGRALGTGSVYAVAPGPSGPRSLLAGAAGGIWRSLDAGASWNRVYTLPNAAATAFVYSPATPDRVYAGLVPGPSQIAVSENRGASWHLEADGLDGPEGIMALLAPRIAGAVLAGTMGNGIWRLDHAGNLWRSSSTGLPPESHGAALLAGPPASHLLWMGTMGKGIYASRDDGRSWSAYGPPLPGNAGIVLALALSAHNLVAGTAVGIYVLPLTPAAQ